MAPATRPRLKKKSSAPIKYKPYGDPDDPQVCRHGGRGLAYVRLSGRMYYLGDWPAECPQTPDTVKQEYRRLLERWIDNGRQLPPPPEEITVTQLCVVYFKWVSPRHTDPRTGKPSTVVINIRLALRSLREMYGDQPAASLTSPRLYDLQAALKRRRLCRSTINDRIAIVRKMYRWSAKRGLIPAGVAGPLRDVDALTEKDIDVKQPRKVLPVGIEQVEATKRHLSPVLAAMVDFMLLTGARPIEAADLRPADVDRSRRVWRYQPQFHKTQSKGKQRVILISPQVQSIIGPYMNCDPESYCFTPQASAAWYRWRRGQARQTKRGQGNGPGSNRRKSPKRSPGKRWTTSSIGQAIHRACDLAFPMPAGEWSDEEIKAWRQKNRWSPNRLRHTFATEMRREHGLEATSVSLGHSSARTSEIYAEPDWERLESIMLKVG